MTGRYHWVEPEDVAVSRELLELVDGNPLVAQALARRGYSDAAAARAFLDPQAYTSPPAAEMPGIPETVQRIEQAIQAGKKICVWGDFDVDGQTSTTLLVSTLRDLGANVSFHIPLRATESHGVNLPVLRDVIAQGAQLVLTCDTGITAFDAADYCRQAGVEFVITDHHDLPSELPRADVLVNPKFLDAGHPFFTLPGVGTAYLLSRALYENTSDPARVEENLDLAALGIVADVATLKGEARFLLQQGLPRLREPRRLGLKMIMDLAQLNPHGLTEEHIGFTLGPRLNALGRLGDANAAVELLTSDDREKVRVLALELEGLNARRQLLTNQVYQAALAQVQRDPSLLNYRALVLAHPAWPAGVVGIVASRLVERFNRPAILISSPPGEMARGSARSLEGVNITEAIASQQALLGGFGGHPMAAGLALKPENLEAFRRGLSRAIDELNPDYTLQRRLPVDGYLPLGELSLDTVGEIERLAPFGQGNDPLTLVSRDLSLKSATALGKDDDHLLLILEDESARQQNLAYRVVWWQGAGYPLPDGRFDLAYTARSSAFRGQREVQIEWVDFRLSERAVIELPVSVRKIEVIDLRSETRPLFILKELQARPGFQVWGEGEARSLVNGKNRLQLTPAEELAIWTAPPDQETLVKALNTAAPERVYLFAVSPETTSLEGFLKRLAGLLKYVLEKQKNPANLAALAAETAQGVSVVRNGLDWLSAKGVFHFQIEQTNSVIVEKGSGKSTPSLPLVEAGLREMLDETAAYRSFFSRVDATSYIQSLLRAQDVKQR